MIYKFLIRPLLFKMEAEKAHDFTSAWARRFTRSDKLSTLVRGLYNYQSLNLAQSFWGLTFRNPIGLAAGFDKNGGMVKAMENLGMGFTEAGSITARASEGNERPRAFRLPKDKALINRMGLNNKGARTVVRSMERSNIIPVGVNIAKTHDPTITGDAAIRDYYRSYSEAIKTADYVSLNISCPNTSDRRTFEDPSALKYLLAALPAVDERKVPTLVKLSPDLANEQLKDLVHICEYYQIDGYVACNTSSFRKDLQTDLKKIEAIGSGGLSGKPIFGKSLATVEQIRTIIGPKKPIIGVGGIHSFETALKMLQAGANLLQVYTGLVYEGPGLVKKINRELSSYLKKHNLSSLKKLNS